MADCADSGTIQLAGEIYVDIDVDIVTRQLAGEFYVDIDVDIVTRQLAGEIGEALLTRSFRLSQCMN